MRKKTFAVLSMLSALSVNAQDLTKAEQGRLDVTRCYITCADQIGRMVPAYFSTALISESTHSVDFGYREVWCESLQIMMNTADTCQAGCRDLEQVYGPVKSYAKTRYQRFFYDIKADLVESGLWTAYNDYPRSNNSPWAFSQACDRYLD